MGEVALNFHRHDCSFTKNGLNLSATYCSMQFSTRHDVSSPTERLRDERKEESCNTDYPHFFLPIDLYAFFSI